MRFTIDREEFLKALNITSKAVNNKNSIPALRNFKIELNEDGLFISGSCIDLSIKTFVPYKRNDVELIRNYKEGICLVDADVLCKNMRKMEGKEIVFDEIDLTVTLSDVVGRVNIQCMKIDEYPPIDLECNGNPLTLTKVDFSTMVNQTAFAASTKDLGRSVFCALNLEASNGVLTAVAGESARLAKKEIKIPNNVEFVANIPARIMVEVEHLLEDAENVDIYVNDKKAIFQFANTVVATTLIDQRYPLIKNAIPRMTKYSLEVSSAEIIKAIERVNVMALEREDIIDLNMSADGVQVTVNASQKGSSEVYLDVFRFQGENFRITIKCEYVLAAIRALESDDVRIEFIAADNPFIIRNPSDDSIIQLCTPMRRY